MRILMLGRLSCLWLSVIASRLLRLGVCITSMSHLRHGAFRPATLNNHGPMSLVA